MYTLCVLGCGSIATDILSGLFADESEKEDDGPGDIVACVRTADSLKKLQELWKDQKNVRICRGENVVAVKEADVVLLGSEPAGAKGILREEGMKEALKGKLLISMVGGLTPTAMRAIVDQSTRVVQAIPNVACKIREGMIVVSQIDDGEENAEKSREVVLSLFSPTGRVQFVAEKHLEVCAALSGCSPAYLLLILESMGDGAISMGVPRQQAVECISQAMLGTARLLQDSAQHPAQVRDSVTTPGGCTAAGLLALEQGNVRWTMAQCIRETVDRMRVMSD